MPRASVAGFVVAREMRPVVAGSLLGLTASVGLTRLLESHVFGVSTTNPWAFALPAVAFVAIALLVCHVPAVRATRVDPASVLRAE